MYKLLTTAAVIMAVATPSIANEWTGAKELTQKLETIYGGVDGHSVADGGGGQFDALQGDFSGTDGQLADFFSTVDKGVTYITLSVDPVTNNISTGINEGVAFSTIQEKQDNLVNRVNFDLFVQDSASADTNIQSYNNDSTYTTVRTVINGDSSTNDKDTNNYSQDTTQGLVGRKVDALTGEVNAVNDFLIASTTSEEQSQAFILAYGTTGVGTFGGDLGAINGHIDGFNTSINAASDLVIVDDSDPDNIITTGSVFGNLPIGALNADGSNVNDFLIPAFNSPTDIGNDALGHSTIADWANGVYNYVTDNGGSGTFTDATGTATIDAAANTVTFGSVTYNVASDGTLTPA